MVNFCYGTIWCGRVGTAPFKFHFDTHGPSSSSGKKAAMSGMTVWPQSFFKLRVVGLKGFLGGLFISPRYEQSNPE